jgi:hypothetical protein
MMTGTAGGDDEVLTGDVLPPPGFGVERTDAKLGNGVYDQSPETLARIRHEHIERQRELKEERAKAFNEGMLAALKDAQKLHYSILAAGNDIAGRVARGQVVSQAERDILKMAQQTAKEVADRGAGKAKTTHEEHKSVSFLGMIVEARKEIERDDTD